MGPQETVSSIWLKDHKYLVHMGSGLKEVFFFQFPNILEFVLDSLYSKQSNKHHLFSFLCIFSAHRQMKMENKDQNTYKILGLRHCKILLSKCRFLEKHPRKFTSSMQIHAVWRISSQNSFN